MKTIIETLREIRIRPIGPAQRSVGADRVRHPGAGLRDVAGGLGRTPQQEYGWVAPAPEVTP